MDTIDARRSAEFWRLLLVLVYRDGHGPVAPGEDDAAGRDWLNVRLPDGTPLLAFQQVAELPRNNLARSARAAAAHLDLTVTDLGRYTPGHEPGRVRHSASASARRLPTAGRTASRGQSADDETSSTDAERRGSCRIERVRPCPSSRTAPLHAGLRPRLVAP